MGKRAKRAVRRATGAPKRARSTGTPPALRWAADEAPFLIPLLALLLLLPVLHLIGLSRNPTWNAPIIDSLEYVAQARELLGKGPASSSPFYHSPLYPLFGAGMALYFASQGSGQMIKPVLAGTARLVLVVAGGALVMQLAGPLPALFGVIALGLTVFGALTAYVVWKAPWGARR